MLGRECSAAVLPDRVLRLPTSSRLLIVKKLLSLSLSRVSPQHTHSFTLTHSLSNFEGHDACSVTGLVQCLKKKKCLLSHFGGHDVCSVGGFRPVHTFLGQLFL